MSSIGFGSIWGPFSTVVTYRTYRYWNWNLIWPFSPYKSLWSLCSLRDYVTKVNRLIQLGLPVVPLNEETTVLQIVLSKKNVKEVLRERGFLISLPFEKVTEFVWSAIFLVWALSLSRALQIRIWIHLFEVILNLVIALLAIQPETWHNICIPELCFLLTPLPGFHTSVWLLW